MSDKNSDWDQARRNAEEMAEKSLAAEREEAQKLAKLLRAEAAASRAMELETESAQKLAELIRGSVKMKVDENKKVDDNDLTKEIFAGLVVALATIPTSIAYSSVVGINPLAGIWSSIIVGASVALIGGAPGLIAGAAGVIALPLSKLYASYG